MKFRSSVVASAGVALLFGWLLATPAFAECDADNAIFADDFQFLDGTWGDADDNYFVEDGYLVIKGWRAQVNFATKSDAADFCAGYHHCRCSGAGQHRGRPGILVG